MNKKLIYAFYAKDDCNNEIYNLHYKLINQYIHLFDDVDLYILYDQYDIKVFDYIISKFNHNNLSITLLKNDPNLKEGKVFYNYIIKNLQTLKDNIVFFGHTKGVTNEITMNLKEWICGIYYFSLNFFDEAIDELNSGKICYGSLYNYDYRNNSDYAYNYIFTGSFMFLHINNLLTFIHDNNINCNNHNNFNINDNFYYKRCAENWISNIVDITNISFHNYKNYNLSDTVFEQYDNMVSYYKIDEQIKYYLFDYEYEDFLNFYNKMTYDKIYIYTLATHIYNNFIPKQLETIKYIFPNQKKYFIILSDKKYNTNDLITKYNLNDYNITLLTYKVPNSSFAINNLLKIPYMLNYLPEDASDDDIALFCDADTIYINRGSKFYDKLYNNFKCHNLIINIHPYENENDKSYHLLNDQNCLEENKAAYIINSNNYYIQTSVFGVKVKYLEKLCKDLNDLILKDESDPYNKHIAHFQEETYLSKIYCDNIECNYNYDIYDDHFNILGEQYEISDDNNIFVNQKYDLTLKNNFKKSFVNDFEE